MSLKFYNTMTRTKEDFTPIHPGKVYIYSCGPTVYNFAHIGNFRAYVFEDLLRRYLKYKGYQITQAINFTDVDDKIIKSAQIQNQSIKKFSAPYKKAFLKDLETLGIQKAEHFPAATDHIPEMVDMVKTLLDKGLAYRSDDGSIYFKVDAYKNYGQLANLNKDEMVRGERVSNDEYEKQQLRDFALWKGWKQEDGDAFWETELGKGRPGWHIECSAMSTKYLGKHFDIHTGGVDNIFPHHENEIAQSEACFDEKFVNYWLHCEHLIIDGEKMSKSLGNFYYLQELLDKKLDPRAIRWVLLSTHYRQKLNFTFDKVKTATKSIERYNNFYQSLNENTRNESAKLSEVIQEKRSLFENCLDDDLNISGAIGAVFSLIKHVNQFRQSDRLSTADATVLKSFIEKTNQVFNILQTVPQSTDSLNEQEQQLFNLRLMARADKNWAEADRLRDELKNLGVELKDSPDGTTWSRI